MRRALLVAVVAALALAAAILLLDDEPRSGRTGAVTTVGDSLNVGIEPYLQQELPGWTITGDDAVGRRTDEGIEALEQLGAEPAPVLVVSLGTNDPREDVDGFREGVRALLALAGPERCVVWATIWRDGPDEAFNDVLADEAGDNRSLRLVEWHRMVAEHPDWLAGDGVHGTPEGYAARAAALADAAADCLPAGPT
jgi:lysophospholipase L1-like esterase